ncbi:hypothetical protein Bca101_089282 [Brassica carinata]
MPPLELLRASEKWISLKSNWESPGPGETLLKKSECMKTEKCLASLARYRESLSGGKLRFSSGFHYYWSLIYCFATLSLYDLELYIYLQWLILLEQ